MTRRMAIFGFGGVLAVLIVGLGVAQYPNIPPTRVPQTAEPSLADTKTLPQKLPSDLERLMNPARPAQPPPGRGAAPEVLQPASNDPPVPAVALRVRAPSHIAAGSPIEY